MRSEILAQVERYGIYWELELLAHRGQGAHDIRYVAWSPPPRHGIFAKRRTEADARSNGAKAKQSTAAAASRVRPALPTDGGVLRRSVACTRSSAMVSGHRPQGGRAGEAL